MRHKTRPAWAIFVLLAALPLPHRLHAQSTTPERTTFGTGDAAVLGAGTVVALLPRILGVGPEIPECAPCEPRTLPALDRWVVREPVESFNYASDLVLIGLGVFALASTAANDSGGPYMTGIAEAAVWTVAATEWAKAGVGRLRPVMYTGAAPSVAGNRDNLRSFPSGHASLAFAFATSYWLARRDLYGRPGLEGWAVAGAAVTVGAFRVLAGKHFLTDVLAGALLGVAGGTVMHAIKF